MAGPSFPSSRPRPADAGRTGAEAGGLAGLGRRVEVVAALAVLVLLAAGCLLVLRPFFSALLWAAILAFSTWPAYDRLERGLRHRPSLAAAIMTVLLALALVLPLALVAATLVDAVTLVADELRRLLERGPPPPPAWVADLPVVGPELLEAWRDLASDTAAFAAFVRPYLAGARSWALDAALGIGAAVLELGVSVFAAFFLYRGGLRVVERLRALGQRIAGDRVHHLLQVVASTTRGAVYGTVGGSVVQGVLAALGFWVAGVPGPLFLGSLTFLLGLVPGGPPLVYVPAALWLLADGHPGWAMFTALWGILVVSGVKSLIKPYLISRESRTPVLLVFLGVAGGAAAFGFIGIFLGPTLLAVAYALVIDWGAAAGDEGRRDGSRA